MTRTLFSRCCLLLCLGALITGCDELPSWMGGGKKHVEPLPGERIGVLHGANTLAADASLESDPIALPAPEANPAWPQHAGNAASMPGHPALPSSVRAHESARAGDGNAFTPPLVTPPVVGDGIVFAMDAAGHVSAHDAKNVARVYWTSKAVANADDEPMLGGGLAYQEGRLYAVSGQGLAMAFDAGTGAVLWRQAVNIPVRSGPKLGNGKVFIATADSQLFALEQTSGSVAWNHRGINEGASFLAGASPAIAHELVVAPYASGEIHVLSVEDGKELWTDSLMVSRRTAATGIFTGIGADPIIADNALYVVSTAGLLAAYRIDNGMRVWEQPISSVNTPFVAGNAIFVLGADDVLSAINRLDGRIYWTLTLPHYKNEEEKKGKYSWSGPVLAGDRLLVTGAHGVMLSITPMDGKIADQLPIPDGVYGAPVIANGVAYVVDAGATLSALY